MIDINNIKGHSKPVKRIITELHSFDRSFINANGDIGFPIGKITELYGSTGIGKSTVAYGLCGLIAKTLNGNISLVDLEDFDPEFLITILETVGFTGDIFSILKDDDEETLDELISNFWDEKKNCVVGILDAIGSISPISERSGELGEANMGRRARLMAQFSRKAIYALRTADDYKSLFLINHQHPKIGGRGFVIPGGETKGYLSSIRIHLKRKYRGSKEELFPDGSYVVEGIIKKNKWGFNDNTFHLFMLAGKGIHPGLTALYDGIELGLVDRSRTIKIGDNSFGYLKDVVQKAHEQNNEFFQPFFDVLKDNSNE